MKRFILLVSAFTGLLLSANLVQASGLTYSGYQPWWNIFAKKNRYMSPEEERLQKFWHDYYHAMKEYYESLDHLDWVAYYKNHGYAINGGCGAGGCSNRINYAPVFVSPQMQWAMPTSCFGGMQCQGTPGMGGPGGPGMGFQGYPYQQ
jgi:hypothetical protein